MGNSSLVMFKIFVFAALIATAFAYSAPQQGGDIECVACEFVVGKVEEYLASNSTVSEIEAALAKVCADLPGSLAGVCQDVVDNYLPDIISALENKEDPDQVCSQIGLCTSVAAPESDCTVCTLIVGEVYSLLDNNATESEIVSALTKACDLLPSSDQAICQNLVQNYVPQIISMIESDFTPTEICTELGFCSSDLAVAAPQDECAICELVVNELESLLAANKTEAEIESALDKICAALPGSFGATCTSLVNSFLPELIAELENGFPANIVCEKVGICTSVAAPEDECATCSLIVNSVEDFIASNKSESFIIAEVEKICAILPGSFSAACDSLVEQDVPAIIAGVEAKETPAVICAKLGKCSSAVKVAAPESSCATCQIVVNTVEEFVASNKSESFIIAELEKLCAILPSQFAGVCDGLVEQDVPAIISAVEAKETPEVICAKLGKCSSVAAPEASAEVCQICELVVTLAEKYASGKSLNNTEIIDLLKGFCNDLPDVSAECTAIVTLFGDEILDAIENGTPAATVCSDIKLCSSSEAAPARFHIARAVRL